MIQSTQQEFKSEGQAKEEVKKVWKLWEHQIGAGHNVYFRDWDSRIIQGQHSCPWAWEVGHEIWEKLSSGKIGRFKITGFSKSMESWDKFFLSVEDLGYLEQ